MPHKSNDKRHAEMLARRAALDRLIGEGGHTITSALREIGVSYTAYRKWRSNDPKWASRVDAMLVVHRGADDVDWGESQAAFTSLFFGMHMSAFQIEMCDAMESTPPGNILMILVPPEHGKTTTYENFACRKIATNSNWRGTIASENITIARRIVSRIRNRLEEAGPYPQFVKRFGPFEPQRGVGRSSQPWAADHFNVFKKSIHDERDYTMMALGYGSSIVSTRTEHLHVDDLQSTKTANETDKMETWFRQDALSRPGESGITTICGTRVQEDDFYERLADDPDLDGILRVIRLGAIVTDHTTGEQRPLWPERYTLEQLDRQRRKVGAEAWDRNYMQQPGASTKGRGTFTTEMIDQALDPNLSLHDLPGERAVVYVGLDPALGSMNCLLAAEVKPEGKLIVRAIREETNLQRNEQIMASLGLMVRDMNQTGRVTDVVIESMNFQKGLVHDERLKDLKKQYGFSAREHLTGVNKYDENIGVASMCGSFIRGEIVLPWAADERTRHEIGELRRQLLAWKPLKRGKGLRQDRVMALWFVWVLWQSRFKKPIQANPDGWKMQGLPFSTVPGSGLVLPVGVRI